MNEQLFKQALEALSETDWQSLFEGQSLLFKDDTELFLGVPEIPNSLFCRADFNCIDASDLKAQIFHKSDMILADYYRSHPLTNADFNHQVEELVEVFGIGAFCAVVGEFAERTFFVEGGEVVSETVQSPRHSYGVFFEMDQPLSGDKLKDAFHQWLTSSGAYFEYVGMNVCRYN